MVQDTSFPPQFYATDDGLKECTVLWAVSVPGESPWCTPSPLTGYKSLRPYKFPIPGAPHLGVQIKIYDSQLAEGLQASDLCTFVGTLTKEPLHRAWLDHDEELEEDQVPTLHVQSTRPTPSTIILRTFPASLAPDVRTVRNQLVDWIAEEALGGDKDAAEWVLLSAIARTQSRTPPILPPSLTLSSFPSPPPPSSSSTPTLHHILALTLPLFTTLPLTLDTLNTTSFFPQDKTGNSDLHSGWLQVPKGMVYLLTEMGITEGQVLPAGVNNLRVVQGVMNDQTLAYEFPFSRFSFPTDISFVVLTEGKKSAFFQTTVNVPLKIANGGNYDLYKPLDQVKLPSEETLSQWRSLVGGSKVGQVTIDDETAKYIQDDFVTERKATTTTSDDLINRMMTAKLLALSYHEKIVTKDIWEETKALEARRKARL